jgi:cytochrome c-type biogenesis protein CcmE
MSNKMHPIRKRRLQAVIVAGVLLSVVASLVLYAMRQNISLFYTPTQVSAGGAPLHHPVRVGGMVVNGSLHYSAGGRVVEFALTDFVATIKIKYKGLLPDLFREGQGVVVNGQIQEKNQVIASEVLAKHDAKYMPPEIRNLAKKVPSISTLIPNPSPKGRREQSEVNEEKMKS